jgi:hypothetical protein
MHLRVTFNNTDNRDSFADRFKLDSKVGENQLDIAWHLLQFAKLDANVLDYDEITLLQSGPNSVQEREFIVKGNVEIFGSYATVIQNLGNDFYLVKTIDGTLLGDYVDSIEHNSGPMQLMGSPSDLTSLNIEASMLDPTAPEGQWARIRVASHYRPLVNQYLTHQTNYVSKPELIIMDSGINFDHPEFDYPELETENFYTLPSFNGSFDDDVGHGTAVAAMAVGKNLGIAQHCKLVSIKIGDANGTGSLLDIGMAIDAILNRVSQDPTKTRIVNMSWGTARSAWLDAKVQGLIDAGVAVICAAGNQGISVEDISPAGIDDVITVGSIDKYDIPSGFNNISPSDAGVTTGHGLSLDLFAPGEGVLIPTNPNSYALGSGTSFSAPLVAGIAVEYASLMETVVLFPQIKKMILDTATTDAILFEDDRFSENQNKIAYLFTSDPNTNFKGSGMTSYLGVHSETGEPIVLDLSSSLNRSLWNKIFPDDHIQFSVEFDDPLIEAEYGPFFEVDATTGLITITKPTVALPEETKLKMIEFVGVATSNKLRMTTNTIFFFYTNPLYKETIQTDITLALTETNSVSFYNVWYKFIK